MAFDFVAHFMGLLALVPSSGAAEIVMVNGQNAKVGLHRSRLAIDAAFVRQKDGDPVPDTYLALPDGRRMAVWDLSHKTVTFHPKTGASPFPKLSYDDDEQDFEKERPDENTGAGWRDIGWLGDASKAGNCMEVPADCQIKKSILEEHALHAADVECPLPTDARIELKTGRLATGRPHSRELTDNVWAFAPIKDAAGSHTRVLSDHFKVRLQRLDGLVVRLKTFKTNKSIDVVVLSPNGDTVQAAFATLPQRDDKTEADHEAMKLPGYADVTYIPHFAAYYALLYNPKEKNIPWRTDKRGISSTECPPAVVRGPGR
jgi:hypothetical protein